MTDIPRPIRSETAVWVGDIYRAPGTLLLYPDKLVHVNSRLPRWGPGVAGPVLALVGPVVERMRAPKKAAAGGKGVAGIPLDSITTVENVKPKGTAGALGGRHLVVTTSEQVAYKFTGTPDYWIADIANALTARGHHVVPTPDGLAVASVPTT